MIKDIDFSGLDSGTIVLFSRQPKCLSRLISIATGSKWSHAGIVLRGKYDENGDPIDEERVYVLESILNIGQVKMPLADGVTLTEIGQRLKHYGNNVKFIKIRHDIPGREVSSDYQRLMWKWYKKNKDKKFDKFFGITYYSRKDREPQYFCSELVAEILGCIGYLRGEKAFHNFSPGDFAEMGTGGDRAERTDMASILVEAHSRLFGQEALRGLSETLMRRNPKLMRELAGQYLNAIGKGSVSESLMALLGDAPGPPSGNGARSPTTKFL